MNSNLWSDEDRLFMPRRFGLGYTINFKYIARKLGWVKPLAPQSMADEETASDHVIEETPEERLRRSIDRSRYEDH
jgi:hypothetical protein